MNLSCVTSSGMKRRSRPFIAGLRSEMELYDIPRRRGLLVSWPNVGKGYGYE